MGVIQEESNTSVGLSYVSWVWDEILGREGGVRCASERFFFSKLVYCVFGRYTCVTGNPL